MSAGVLSAQVIASLAAAGPPGYRAVSEGHRELPVRNAVPTKLDLHAPATPFAQAAPAYAGGLRDAARTDVFAPQPAWRGDGPRLRDMTDIQELAHGIRRNGLPLARLWQGPGALVSVGLSPKGKPGLWFVKQLP